MLGQEWYVRTKDGRCKGPRSLIIFGLLYMKEKETFILAFFVCVCN